MKRLLKVTYPPDFDGELNVLFESGYMDRSVSVSFTIARNEGETELEAVRRACRDIYLYKYPESSTIYK